MFADPWNPSSKEVRTWAYSPGAEYPCEDWELALAWARHEQDYIDFASDLACPTKSFFLHVLYYIVGKAVRDGLDLSTEAIIRGFVERGAASKDKDVHRWRERSLRLLKNPAECDYEAWCCGGFASGNGQEVEMPRDRLQHRSSGK